MFLTVCGVTKNIPLLAKNESFVFNFCFNLFHFFFDKFLYLVSEKS